MFARGSAAISPTAHYTGAVWARHGLSHPALATLEGRALHAALRPAMLASRAAGGPTLEGMLLARHRVIDHLLETAIADGRVGQVVEMAAGLSPRGWRFSERHGRALVYVEADLPAMAARKRRALARAGAGPGLRVVDLDAFAENGLDAVAARLDRQTGTAVVTEGLLNYFPRPAVEGLWRRIARTLSGFSAGLYLSDLHLGTETSGLPAQLFTGVLSAFVRGRVHLHFPGPADATAALHDAGFPLAQLHRPGDFHLEGTDDRSAGLVRILEARTVCRAAVSAGAR